VSVPATALRARALKSPPSKGSWSMDGGRAPFVAPGEGAAVPVLVGLETGRKGAVWHLPSTIIDTGADRSGIPESAVKDIEHEIGPLKKVERPVLTASGLQRITMIEDVKVCVGMGPVPQALRGRCVGNGTTAEDLTKSAGGCCRKTTLLVIPDLQAHFLLGRDLMMPCKARIDYDSGRFCFNNRCAKMEGS